MILRIAQGFALGGEWSGAALVATENAPTGKRAWYGTFPQLGAPIGFIIANGLFLIIAAALPSDDPSMPSQAFLDWGWRIPFLFSVVMVDRRPLGAPAPRRVDRVLEGVEGGQAHASCRSASVFKNHWRQLILGTFFMLATYVLFYLMTTFSLELRPCPASKPPTARCPASATRTTPSCSCSSSASCSSASSPCCPARWADRWGRRKTLIWVTLGIIVFGLLWVPLLGAGFWGVMLWLVVGFSLMGLTFGPMGALLPELFPTNVRYTGSGISYNVSSILGAAVAPFIAVALWQAGDGSPFWVGVYLSVMAVLTLIALLVSKETKDVDIDA